MKKYWFRNKEYGWGWVPITWQGWLIIILYILFIIKQFLLIDIRSHSVSDTLIGFLPRVIFATIILIGICFLAGEKPSWSWGNKSKKEKEIEK